MGRMGGMGGVERGKRERGKREREVNERQGGSGRGAFGDGGMGFINVVVDYLRGGVDVWPDTLVCLFEFAD